MKSTIKHRWLTRGALPPYSSGDGWYSGTLLKKPMYESLYNGSNKELRFGFCCLRMLRTSKRTVYISVVP